MPRNNDSNPPDNPRGNPPIAQNKKLLKKIGLLVQILTYITNAVLWCLAMYSTVFAIVIGLSSGTISTEDGDVLDWMITTPATVFLYYGLPLLAIATFGCFATVSANYISVVIYIVLIASYTVYDVAFGISLLGGATEAYDEFIESLRQSQYGYSDDNPQPVGIIGVHPKQYWDHLQRRGKCCGLYSYEDWKNTSLAKMHFSIPDSCCNNFYEYFGCGQLVWKHPDHAQHTIESIIFDRGCLTIFPEYIQSDEDDSIAHLGRFLIAMLFIAVLLSIALFVLVISRAFRTSIGLNNPDFIDAPADPTLLSSRRNQVHPGPDSRGDRDETDSRDRKISFDDKGPTYVPDRQRDRDRQDSSPSRSYSPPRDRSRRNRRDY